MIASHYLVLVEKQGVVCACGKYLPFPKPGLLWRWKITPGMLLSEHILASQRAEFERMVDSFKQAPRPI